MGTRGITAVVLDGEYRVSQYGQWDHYPEGQGRDAAQFLDTIMDPMADDLYEGTALGRFKEKIRQTYQLNEEQIDAINTDLQTPGTPELSVSYPHLSRDTGAKILELIFRSEEPVGLILDLDFPMDGLSCEGIYVVDLDKETFEVYGDRYEDVDNPKPFTEDERFRKVDTKPYETSFTLSYEYYPPRLLKSFNLNDFTLAKYDEWLEQYNKELEEAEEQED